MRTNRACRQPAIAGRLPPPDTKDRSGSRRCEAVGRLNVTLSIVTGPEPAPSSDSRKAARLQNRGLPAYGSLRRDLPLAVDMKAVGPREAQLSSGSVAAAVLASGWVPGSGTAGIASSKLRRTSMSSESRENGFRTSRASFDST